MVLIQYICYLNSYENCACVSLRSHTYVRAHIGRSVLREENKDLEDAITKIPLDWVLTETDSEDPSSVVLVAEKIAELKGFTKEEVGSAATRNLKRLLGL